jgi:hypothetical protein
MLRLTVTNVVRCNAICCNAIRYSYVPADDGDYCYHASSVFDRVSSSMYTS